jgi:DNA helicase-2/ATP-dependent DNA helicase PcrA
MYRVAGLLFEQSVATMAWLDYDDMVWFPAAGKVSCKQFDVLFIDEAQDLNKAQAALVMNSIKPGGRIIAVGDRNQSIYSFAGADSDSIPNLIDLLSATVMPLSTTYRCPKSHVALAQRLVPQIEAAAWAAEGTVRDVNEYEFVSQVTAGDLVLCRCNAPLVVPAFLLIRRGIKAVILGRDIGRGLKLLLSKVQKKHGVHNLLDTLAALVEYGDKEIGKLLKMRKQSRAQALEDRIETIIALADGSSSMGQLEDKIETIFSDAAEGVTFSSVHRAKGAEADRVWILRPDLMPHPRVSAAWEMQQEYNIQYVALTRAKRELCFVQE